MPGIHVLQIKNGGKDMFKVLILEDDRELNRSLCAFLRQHGYEPTGCENARDAYEIGRAHV